MNILLLGSGGREHALAWRLAQSALVANGGKLYAAPGNPGIAEHARLITLDLANHPAVLAACRDKHIGLVVIGPEAPLVAGLADVLRAGGIAVFGPSGAAARLEGSKGFTKDLCARVGIPTAAYARVASKAEARAALARFGLPVVVKADGLAAGKGVTIAASHAEAEAAIAAIFADDADHTGDAEAVIEEFLTGEEVSYFVLSDGQSILPFASAQDHKRVGEGDTGPNTGGMGAVSPARALTPEIEQDVLARIVTPTLSAMAAAGTPFVGVLFAGLMLTADGPKLIEYNCRFGDPECQVMLARLEGDLGEVLLACATGELAALAPPRFSPRPAIAVVLAARGYPEAPQAGGMIAGLAEAESQGGDHVKLFHAGTARRDDGALVANGGRVLTVTARAPSLHAARDAAYRAVDAITAPALFCRRDIGARAIARESDDPHNRMIEDTTDAARR